MTMKKPPTFPSKKVENDIPDAIKVLSILSI